MEKIIAKPSIMEFIKNKYASKWFFGIFLLLGGAAIPATIQGKETPSLQFPSEQEAKLQFEYSFNEVSDKIVTISCIDSLGRSMGSGFIGTQDGKTYLFTNQHVILGTDRISFRSSTGKALHPRSVELSTSRDIARLLLDDEVANGFRITEKVAKGTPVAIFGNSEGAGVTRELYGEVIDMDADSFEVSAEIISGNSGSPVLNPNREVLGIASYVRWFDNDKDGSKTRRYCYRLTGDHWKPVNWKTYNAKHGKQHLECKQFADSIAEIATTWCNAPYSRLAAENYSDRRLRNWANRYNEIIDNIMHLSDKGEATQRKLDLTNNQIKQDIKNRARVLTLLCSTSSSKMKKLSEQRELTAHLRNEYIRLCAQFDATGRVIEYHADNLSKNNFFHFR